MSEPMTVRAEIWPVVPDPAGLWLASGDRPWLTAAVMADQDIHYEVALELWCHGIDVASVAACHSTSWRPDGTSMVVTYMAALRPVAAARALWPDACPVTADLAEAVGPAPTHAAADAPVPRVLDVLHHGLRHLAFLLDHDAENADALGERWRECLEPFTPALAGMYGQLHDPAA